MKKKLLIFLLSCLVSLSVCAVQNNNYDFTALHEQSSQLFSKDLQEAMRSFPSPINDYCLSYADNDCIQLAAMVITGLRDQDKTEKLVKAISKKMEIPLNCQEILGCTKKLAQKR